MAELFPSNGLGMLLLGEVARIPGEFGPGGDAWGTLRSTSVQVRRITLTPQELEWQYRLVGHFRRQPCSSCSLQNRNTFGPTIRDRSEVGRSSPDPPFASLLEHFWPALFRKV